MDKAFEAYAALQIVVKSKVQDWQPGTPFAVTPSLGSRLGALQTSLTYAVAFFAKLFRGSLALHASVCVVFLPVALLYLRLLHKSLRKTNKITLYTSRASTNMGVVHLASAVRGLKRAYHLMVIELSLIAVSAHLFLGATAFTAFQPAYINNLKDVQNAMFVAVFWIFAVGALATKCAWLQLFDLWLTCSQLRHSLKNLRRPKQPGREDAHG
jgi:hypothetical protein